MNQINNFYIQNTNLEVFLDRDAYYKLEALITEINKRHLWVDQLINYEIINNIYCHDIKIIVNKWRHLIKSSEYLKASKYFSIIEKLNVKEMDIKNQKFDIKYPLFDINTYTSIIQSYWKLWSKYHDFINETAVFEVNDKYLKY